MFDKFKKSVMNEFKMFNMNLMQYFFGIEVIQSIYGNFLFQKNYIREILNRFNLICTRVDCGTNLHNHYGNKVDNTYFK